MARATKQIFSLIMAVMALTACAPHDQSGEVISGNNPEIVGGMDVGAELGFGRSVVALYDLKDRFLCSATLVSTDTVITAAHCVPRDPSTMVVKFTRDVRNSTSATERSVRKAVAHPGYTNSSQGNKSEGNNDIAVMKFSGGIPSGYTPAPILTNPMFLQNGIFVFVAGFGITDGQTRQGSGTLRETMTILTDAFLNAREVAIDQGNGRGSCSGDSGGPVFVKVGNAYYLFGVVSRGDKYCVSSGIYTNVTAYRSWINEQIRLF